jgi:hypothetical protein
MAIAYKSQGAGAETESSGAALNLVAPATVDANDILVAHVVHLNNTTAPSTPSGWALLFGPSGLGTGTPTGRAWAFGKIAVGDEDGATISFGTDGGTSGRFGRIYSFSGYVSGTITDVIPAASFAESSSETDPIIQAVTTTVAGAKAVALVSQDDDNVHAALGDVGNGTWVEAVADFVSTTVGVQGGCMQISGGTVAGTNDEANTLNFEIRPNAITDVEVALTSTSGSGAAGTLALVLSLAVSGLATTAAVGSLAVALTLSGVAATGAVESSAVASSIGLSGAVGTGALGSVVTSADSSAELSGVGGTGAVDAVLSSRTIALSGVGGTGAVGAPSPGVSPSLTGLGVTGTVGAVSLGVDLPLSGHVGSATPGAVGVFGLLIPTSGGMTDDEEALLLLDVVVPDVTAAVSGVAGAAAVGSVGTEGVAISVSGVVATGSVDTLATARALPLTGLIGNTLIGTILAGTDVSVTTTGTAATGVVGGVAPDMARAAEGVVAAAAVGGLVATPTVGVGGEAGTGAVGVAGPATATVMGGHAATAAVGSVGTAKDGAALVMGVGAVGAVGVVDTDTNVTRPVTTVAASGDVGSGGVTPEIPCLGEAALGSVQTPASGVSVSAGGAAAMGAVGAVVPSVTVIQTLPGLIEASIDDGVFGLSADTADDPLGVVLAYD